MPTHIQIHPSAMVSSKAQVSSGVNIGPYAVIEDNVTLGENCEIAAHAVIRSGTILKEAVAVDSFAVIGGAPQDLKFDPRTASGVMIGAHTVIREGVTIHRATAEHSNTTVGEHAYIMGNVHIAHDCTIGDEAVLANNTLLAGWIDVGPQVFIGGGAAIHQFVKIGRLAMLGGQAAVTSDIPPFVTLANRSIVYGLNLIGLRRRQIPRDAISDIKACYKEVYFHEGKPQVRAMDALEKQLYKTEYGEAFLRFFESSKIGRFSLSRRSSKSGD